MRAVGTPSALMDINILSARALVFKVKIEASQRKIADLVRCNITATWQEDQKVLGLKSECSDRKPRILLLKNMKNCYSTCYGTGTE